MADGMTTLLQDGIQKVVQGVTDFKQVRAVCIKYHRPPTLAAQPNVAEGEDRRYQTTGPGIGLSPSGLAFRPFPLPSSPPFFFPSLFFSSSLPPRGLSLPFRSFSVSPCLRGFPFIAPPP